MEQLDVRQELLTLLDYYREQIKNNQCTMDTMLAFYRILMENMNVVGTVEDFARFYGVSEANVRNVISRYMVKKPKRRVFYDFHEFLKIIPPKWRNIKA